MNKFTPTCPLCRSNTIKIVEDIMVCDCGKNKYIYHYHSKSNTIVIRLTYSEPSSDSDLGKFLFLYKDIFLNIKVLPTSNIIEIHEFYKNDRSIQLIDISDACKAMSLLEIVDYAKKLLVFL